MWRVSPHVYVQVCGVEGCVVGCGLARLLREPQDDIAVVECEASVIEQRVFL
jgi:hypothetical protein